MTLNKKWLFLLILILIYWIGASVFYETGKFNYTIQTNKPFRYLIHFGILFFTGIFGYFGLKYIKPIWLKDLWLLLYSIIITVFILFGLIDYYIIKFENVTFRNLLSCLHLFFASPVTYGIMLLLSKKINSKNS
jgi:cell division protein FtsW (lipid II flippase)